MNTSKQVIELIQGLRKENKISVEELAKRVGIAKSTLSRYENGQREFPINDVGKYAKVFNVTVEYLLGLPERPTNTIDIQPNFVKIPILGAIACGEAALVYESVEGYTAEPISDLPSGSVFALRAKGESMLPTIPDGALVIIREQAVVENGEIAAVLLNGDTEATLKRIKRQGDVLLLVPDNKDYDIIIVDDNNPARIIGKAISVKYKL